VDQEWDSTTQDADQKQITVRVIRADLFSQFFDAGLQGFFVYEYFSEYIVVMLHSSSNFVLWLDS
jgi:hypothetical protein